MSHEEWTPRELLAPLSVEVFLDKYWEQEPRLVPRDDLGYFGSLLSLENIDDILVTGQLHADELQIVRDDDLIDPSKYCRHIIDSSGRMREIDPSAVVDHFRNGASLVFKSLQKRRPPLARLCAQLEALLNVETWANVYATPASSNALRVHYDTHDVFIIQIHGQKSWRILGAPVPFPISYAASSKGLESPEVLVCQMNAGDLLYIPRGYMHEARTGDKQSVHITIALQTITWARVLRETVSAIAEQEPAFRRSMPLPGRREKAQMEETYQRLIQHMLGCEHNLHEVIKTIRRPGIETASSIAQGPLSLEDRLTTLCDETLVVSPNDTTVATQLRGDHFVISHKNREIQLPCALAPILKFLLSGEEVCLAALNEFMSTGSRDHLIRVLIREGVLSLA
jgi:ribosomal protein L16 Arg81 hydroxylase